MSGDGSSGDKERKRMGNPHSVDLLRGVFGDIVKNGSEQHRKLTSAMRKKAMADCNMHVKEGEYVELDLYGRGDPRAFKMFEHSDVSNEETTQSNKGFFRSKLAGLMGKKIGSLFGKLSERVANGNTSSGGYVRTATSDCVDNTNVVRK